MTSDFIERGAAIKTITSRYDEVLSLGDVIETLDSVPSVDVGPRHARWQGVSPFVNSLECSECRYCVMDEEFRTPYCPWCGAVMDNWEDE